MKEHKVLLVNGIILIVVSLIGYFLSPVKSPTAFIGAVFGLVFIFLANPVKAENATMAHIAAVLMVIATIAFFVVGFMRGNTYTIIMGITSLISVVLLVMGFMKRKKERAAGV